MRSDNEDGISPGDSVRQYHKNHPLSIPIAALGLFLFLLGSFWYLTGIGSGLEKTMIEAFGSVRNPVLDPLAVYYTSYGNTEVIIFVDIILIVSLFVIGLKKQSMGVLGFSLLMWSMSMIMKLHFARDRPDLIPWLVDPVWDSFPSGHSMVSNSIYGIFFLLLIRKSPKRAKPALYVWIATAVLMGLSRIYVGVHYPSDVLAGIGLCFMFHPLIRAIVVSDREGNRSKRT